MVNHNDDHETKMPTNEKYLGEFEQLILLAILNVNNRAYGTEIATTILEKGQREVTLGALYTSLTRLQTKGLVASEMGEATAERGGRAKKYFTVTAQGQSAIKRSLSLIKNMSKSLNLNKTMGDSIQDLTA